MTLDKIFCNTKAVEKIKEEVTSGTCLWGIPLFTSELLQENQMLLLYKDKDGKLVWELFTLP